MGARPSKERMLYDCVRTGDIHMIRYLHRQGAYPNWMSSTGKTPLILACSAADRLPIAKTLIELGADVNYHYLESSEGTAILKAAKRGLEQTVVLLLSHGANPLLRDDYSRNALDCAREEGHTRIVRAIENKICFFSGWLRDTWAKRIWAVVLPSDYTLSRNVPELRKIALYRDQQSPCPFNVVFLEKFDVQEPDFLLRDPALVLCRKSSGAKLEFRSGEEGDKEQLKLLYDTCRRKMKVYDPSSEAAARATPQRRPPSSPMPISAPSTTQEEAEMAMAISASIQSAVEEGIPLSDEKFGRTENTPPATVAEDRGLAGGEGTSGLSSCVVCNDAPIEAACVPCGHLAGCMACLTQVKMKNFGCPVCRARIERIMKIYLV